MATTTAVRRRWAQRLVLLGVVAVVAAGCDLAGIPGEGPLRRTLGMLRIPAVMPVFADLDAATSTR